MSLKLEITQAAKYHNAKPQTQKSGHTSIKKTLHYHGSAVRCAQNNPGLDAGEHIIDALADARLVRELQEQPDRLGGNAMLNDYRWGVQNPAKKMFWLEKS